MVVRVEPEPVGTLVVFVVGNEQVGGVANEQAFGIEQLQGSQQARHFAVEPGMQALDAGIAGELAQEILVARRLAVMAVLVVEARTGQRHLAGLRMAGLASAPLRPERLDQAAGAQ